MSNAAGDANLREAFRKLTVEVFDLMKPLSSLPQFTRPRLQVEAGPSFLRFNQVPAIAWEAILATPNIDFQHLTALPDLVGRLLSSESAVNKVRSFLRRGDGAPLSEDDLRRHFETLMIPNWLRNYFSQLNSPSFDNDKFEKIYDDFEDWLLSGFNTIRSRTLLQAFRGPAHTLNFEHDVTLRQATNEDLTEFATLGTDTSEIGYERWMVEVQRRVPSDSGLDAGGVT